MRDRRRHRNGRRNGHCPVSEETTEQTEDTKQETQSKSKYKGLNRIVVELKIHVKIGFEESNNNYWYTRSHLLNWALILLRYDKTYCNPCEKSFYAMSFQWTQVFRHWGPDIEGIEGCQWCATVAQYSSSVTTSDDTAVHWGLWQIIDSQIDS